MKTIVGIIFVFMYTSAIPITKPDFASFHRDAQNVIVEGSAARRHQFPYQISLQKTEFGISEHVCGGSIITPTFIVTAGHCVYEYNWKKQNKLRVVAGLLKKDEEDHPDVQIAHVVRTFIHPDFNEDTPSGIAPNDIALLKLDRRLRYTKAVKPIKLPEPGDEPTGIAHLSGWGAQTDGFFPEFPNRLQHVTVTLLNFDECKTALNNTLDEPNPLTPTMTCTRSGYEGVSGCMGDSGGPLQQDNKLIGVVQWVVRPCGKKGAPTMYTKTSYYIYFIRNIVNDF